MSETLDHTLWFPAWLIAAAGSERIRRMSYGEFCEAVARAAGRDRTHE